MDGGGLSPLIDGAMSNLWSLTIGVGPLSTFSGCCPSGSQVGSFFFNRMEARAWLGFASMGCSVTQMGCGSGDGSSSSCLSSFTLCCTWASVGITSPPWWAVLLVAFHVTEGSHFTRWLCPWGRTTLLANTLLDWSSRIKCVNTSPTLSATPTHLPLRSRVLGQCSSWSK